MGIAAGRRFHGLLRDAAATLSPPPPEIHTHPGKILELTKGFPFPALRPSRPISRGGRNEYLCWVNNEMKRSTLYFFVFIAGLIILTTRKFLRDVTGLGFEWSWMSVLGAAVLGLIIFGLRYHKDVDRDLESDGDKSITDEKDRDD